MPRVEYILEADSDPILFESAVGDSILFAGEAEGHDLPCGCHQGHCGACVVEVLEGTENLSELSPGEEYSLSRIEAPPTCRLACRACVSGPVKVRAHDAFEGQ